jgi:pimeloyl-ACP methyl ester carboxylesterase
MVVIILVCILFIPFLLGYVMNYLSKDKTVNPLILEKLVINEAIQWISVSEEPSVNNKPVVLFLHGGPGSANLSLLNQLCPGLNEHAVIVNWDQRNAGKSFNFFQSGHSLNLEQIIKDAHRLTQYLKEKYKVEKITLMGFSAGTAIGIMLVDRYPEDYDLFISVAQMVDGTRGEILSLDHVLEKARENNDTKAIRDLEKIKFDFSKPQEILKNTQRQRKYLLKYGGVYHNFHSYAHESKSLWRSREYSFLDFINWPLASLISLKAVWHEVVLLKIDELVPVVDVPVVFFSGRYDMNNPMILVKEYYGKLDAPNGKELILFEDSAHSIFWDEPERFEAEVIMALEKYTR